MKIGQINRRQQSGRLAGRQATSSIWWRGDAVAARVSPRCARRAKYFLNSILTRRVAQALRRRRGSSSGALFAMRGERHLLSSARCIDRCSYHHRAAPVRALLKHQRRLRSRMALPGARRGARTADAGCLRIRAARSKACVA